MSTTHCVNLRLIISSQDKRIDDVISKILDPQNILCDIEDGVNCSIITVTVIEDFGVAAISLEKLKKYLKALEDAGDIVKSLTGADYTIHLIMNSY